MLGRRLLVVLLVSVGLARSASASKVLLQDLAELTAGSSDIVVGRVESVRSYWTAGHTQIFTETVLSVRETLKGSDATTLKLVQLGGEVDGARVTVDGMPAFSPQQEALVFVWRDPQGRAQVNGLAQGKFDITRDPATGEQMVTRNLPGFERAAKPGLRARPLDQRPQRLSDLKSAIRALVPHSDR